MASRPLSTSGDVAWWDDGEGPISGFALGPSERSYRVEFRRTKACSASKPRDGTVARLANSFGMSLDLRTCSSRLAAAKSEVAPNDNDKALDCRILGGRFSAHGGDRRLVLAYRLPAMKRSAVSRCCCLHGRQMVLELIVVREVGSFSGEYRRQSTETKTMGQDCSFERNCLEH